MPYIKPISGHTGLAATQRYLTRTQRAIASDYLNLTAMPARFVDGLPEYGSYDWARTMDTTRAAQGNDRAWKGRAARTYKHYVISPDPADNVALDDLRRLTLAWVREYFADYEVAIIYHDDNENRIPHAHVVVNNTNLETGKRLQDADPAAMNRRLQAIARERGLHYLENPPKTDRLGNIAKTPRPHTWQQTYVRRAETELAAKGQYSWVADIRARVTIARNVAMNCAEFESVLASLGVSVADNSPKATRRDWIYSFDKHPSWRISGEKLGLSYGRVAVTARLNGGSGMLLSTASERQIVALACDAYAIGNLDELHEVAAMVQVNENYRIGCMDDYERAIALLKRKPESPRREKQLVALVQARETAAYNDILPQHHTNVDASQSQSRIRRNSNETRPARTRRESQAERRTAERGQQRPSRSDDERKEDAR